MVSGLLVSWLVHWLVDFVFFPPVRMSSICLSVFLSFPVVSFSVHIGGSHNPSSGIQKTHLRNPLQCAQDKYKLCAVWNDCRQHYKTHAVCKGKHPCNTKVNTHSDSCTLTTHKQTHGTALKYRVTWLLTSLHVHTKNTGVVLELNSLISKSFRSND